MRLSNVEQSLILAAYYRCNLKDDQTWTSCSDQVVTLSLFYTGEIDAAECQKRFAIRSYLSNLYDDQGELSPEIRERYKVLIKMINEYPHLIEGGGDMSSPADPTFTACRLTEAGIKLATEVEKTFLRKPVFPNWPDRRSTSK